MRTHHRRRQRITLAVFAGTAALAVSQRDSTGVLVSYANLGVLLLIAGSTLPAPLLWATP